MGLESKRELRIENDVCAGLNCWGRMEFRRVDKRIGGSQVERTMGVGRREMGDGRWEWAMGDERWEMNDSQ